MSQLQANYQQIAQHASELEKVLLAEESLLGDRDINGTQRSQQLAEFAELKNNQVQVLDQLEKTRQQLLHSHPADPRLQETWSAILDTLARCQQLNLRNGRQINSLSRYTRRALEILGREDAATPVYRADGSTTNQGRRHSFGIA